MKETRETRKEPLRNAILIAGPTASGKSALALALARETGGIVVNTDSMQVYAVLDRLTARPGAEEMAQAPHRLYGHVSPAEPYSTGRWLADVAALASGELVRTRPTIFVGGTGLYFKALTEGLSAMPDIPEDIRAAWRFRLERDGAPALHSVLVERDAASAARIRPADGQRIVRALEVLETSGRPIGYWQGARGDPIVDASSAKKILIEPDRDELAQRIDARVRKMAAGGALDEVRTLLSMRVTPSMPAMKAIGVREFAQVLDGVATLETAVDAAAAATRRYARRQSTWFRHQLGPGWAKVSLQSEIIVDIAKFSTLGSP